MTQRSADAAGKRLQEEFEAQASALNLPTEASACEAETRTVGVAFMMFKKTVRVQVADEETAAAPASGDAADAAIAQVLTGYESLLPEDFAKEWRDYASDPHMGVGTSWVGQVDQDAVDYWLSSNNLAKALSDYPMYSPRRVQLQDLQVTYIGNGRAAATYRVEEEHTTGQKTAGNSAAILMNVADQGWRIVVVTKGGRGEI